MPRDDHHAPKSAFSRGSPLVTRLLGRWTSRVVVPALANEAAAVEMAARAWLRETAPRRGRVAARLAAQPVAALLIAAGLAYLAGVAQARRPRPSRSRLR